MANVFGDFADPEKDVVSSNPFEEFGGPEARKPGNPFSEFQGPDNEELTAPFAEFPDQNQEVIKSSLKDTLPPLLMNEAVTMRKAQDIGASLATSAVKGTGEALSGAAAVAGFFAKEQIKAAEKWQPEALPDKEKLMQVKPEELVPYQAGQKIFNWAKAQDESRPKLIGPTTKQMADTVGSTIPYLAATAVNPWLGVIAGVGGDAKEFYDDAKLKGASQEDAEFAMMMGGLVGTTEMAPIELALTPLNKLPGGRAIKKGLLRFFRSHPNVYKAAQAGSEAAFTAAGEAIQEDLVQLTKNLTASDFVGYDPDRPWQENLAETTGYSAGAGAIVSAIAQMLRIKGVVPPATVGVIGPRDVTSDGVLPTPEDMENMTTRALTALKDVDPTGDYNKKTVLRSMTKGGAGKAELDTVKAMFADPRLTDDKGKMKGRVLLDGLKEAMYPLTEQVQGAGSQGLRATYGLGLWDPTVNPASVRRGEIPEFIPLWALPKLRELSNSMRGMSEEELRNPDPEVIKEFLRQELVEEPNRLDNLASGDYKLLTTALKQAGLEPAQATSLGAVREMIDTVLDDNNLLAAGSWTFNAPFPTYMNRVKHYEGHERFITPNYVGHIRAFFHPKTPGTFFVAETQSDRTHHLQDIERVRNDLETSRDQAELDQITSQLAPLQEALTALENAGLTDAVQAVRKAENVLDDRFASVPEAIDAVQNTMHDLLRKEKELFDAIDEKTRFLAKNQKLNELGEQPMLNRMAQRAAVIAHRQGATHVAFPLPETVGALQMWRIETPQGERWIPQLTATELNEIGEKKIRIADS
ncbi:MAG: hypothetical protein ACWGQW_08270, partial [bacterium]